ncbi:MAG: tetratricopeptide repeat protein [Promethearchaeota archaeon]
MSNSEPKELTYARQFINKGNFDKAIQIISDFEKKGGITAHAITSCHLLKCDLLIQRGCYENALNLAEQTYKESMELGKNLLSVDALIYSAKSLVWLNKHDKALNITNQAEKLLKSFTLDSSTEYKQREAYIFFIKSLFNFFDLDERLNYAEQSLLLREELGIKNEIAESMRTIAHLHAAYKGEFDYALDYLKRGLSFAEESKNKYCIAMVLRTLMLTYGMRGDFDQAIIYGLQGLAIFEEINNKPRISLMLNTIGTNYRMKGELDRALEYLQRSIAICEELGLPSDLALVFGTLIEITVDMDNLELAQKYLERIKQIRDQEENEWINLLYRFGMVDILKTSKRAKNRVKAEKLLKEIIEESFQTYFTILAILSLSDLLLVELRITSDTKVLVELKTYINRLLEYAETSNSYWLLAETYLLQAKISLININIGEARRYLIQAQQIAERNGLSGLYKKIENEHEKLLSQLTLWEQLKELNATITERMELANISEHMNLMLRNRRMITIQTSKDKVAIQEERIICLVCKGDIVGFSYVCECEAMYCENCAKTLANLENVCWVCNVPIDKSRPTKPYMKDERKKEMKISEKNQKEINE